MPLWESQESLKLPGKMFYEPGHVNNCGNQLREQLLTSTDPVFSFKSLKMPHSLQF